MEILTTNAQSFFNLDVIHEGGFIIAKHSSWKESRNGIIVFAAGKVIHVLYQPLKAGATGYFSIKVSEVVANEWILKYTEDFTEIATYGNGDS